MAYTTSTLVSAQLNGVEITSSTVPSDSSVQTWIDESDSEIDIRTGQVWSSTTVSSTIVDYDGSGYLRFPNAPLISITKVEYNANNNDESADWTELTGGLGNDFISYLADGEIKFMGNSTLPTQGLQRMRLTYVHGHSTVPNYIQRLSTLMTSKRFIQSVVFADAKEQGGSVTVGNISISDPTNFGSSQIRDIDNEIEDILGKRINSTHVYRPSRDYRSTIR